MMQIGALLRLMEVRPFKGRTGPEDRLAIEVANSLRAWSIEGKLLATWTHIPHEVGGGGITAKVRMALAKAMGLIKGSGDYVFVWAAGGGWIELKTDTGSLNPLQKDFRDWCAAREVRWARARSVEEFTATLVEWGALRL